MAAPVAVLYLITSSNVGGAEKALLQLIKNIDRRSYRVYVCSVKKPGTFAHELALAADGFFSLNCAEQGRAAALFSAVPALVNLVRLLRSISPAILHCFLFRANILGRIAGRLARVPVIISSVRVLETSAFNNALDRMTASLESACIAVSEAARSYTIAHAGIAPQNITTIYNGIDCSEGDCEAAFSRADVSLDEEDIVLAVIGRLHRQKGQRIVLEALPGILAQASRVRVLFCGEGIEEPALRKRAGELGIAGQVRFLGLVENAARLLPHIDILVLPSLWEGMPHVVLEAMAAARPVVASRIAGLDELVVDGETGLLFNPGDPQSLAAALLVLITDRGRSRRMGEAGRTCVMKQFQLTTTVQKTVQLYEKLLHSRTGDHQQPAMSNGGRYDAL
jgi:glycosyltransferase involved in cell wall biosynthesis